MRVLQCILKVSVLFRAGLIIIARGGTAGEPRNHHKKETCMASFGDLEGTGFLSVARVRCTRVYLAGERPVMRGRMAAI